METGRHVFLVGAKSLGAYGGYETFVDKLTLYHQKNGTIQYHVACKANGDGCMDETKLSDVTVTSPTEFVCHGAHCFKLSVPQIGPAQAIWYDVKALRYCCRYIRENRIARPVIYIMACRIGPFMRHYYRRLKKLGASVYLNPDGHEWKRAKWNRIIRKYWKFSESRMVKYCDLVICDSVNIERYIHESYDGRCRNHANPETTYIAYGAETRRSLLADGDARVENWYRDKGLSKDGYYLVVGRFVPENNYETMIREFMRSATAKRLAVITNVNDRFLDVLEERLNYRRDERIRFVGTVYDPELLMKIRENAYGYLHGHEVGGTNPSLLEALSATRLNLLLDVGFNREVAENAALYWTKEEGSLANLIDRADHMDAEEADRLGAMAKKRIEDAYSWKSICNAYERVFLRDEQG